MTELQKEALEAVGKINTELYKKYSKLDAKDKYKDWISITPMLSITISGNYTFIGLSIPSKNTCSIPEFHIYNSEDNDRIYYEKSDKYETFYKFIKRKFIEIKNEVNLIKL